MAAPTFPQTRRVVFLPVRGLGPEADCWERLHEAYSRWMVQTRTYTPARVAMLYSFSARAWDAHSRTLGEV